MAPAALVRRRQGPLPAPAGAAGTPGRAPV